jgi:hypothetical protein
MFFMKRAILIMGVVFMITLAIVFGLRVSADALAVVIGVILGIVASVPATALVVYMLMRPRPNNYQQSYSPQAPQQPPVVIINASDPNRQLGAGPPPAWPSPGPTVQARKWTVIGDTDTEIE